MAGKNDITGLWGLGDDMGETVRQFGMIERPEVDYLEKVVSTGEIGNVETLVANLGKYSGKTDLPSRAIRAANLSRLATDELVYGSIECRSYYGPNPFTRELEKRLLTFDQLASIYNRGQTGEKFDMWLHERLAESLVGKRMDYGTYARFFLHGIFAAYRIDQLLCVDPDTVRRQVHESAEYDGRGFVNDYYRWDMPFKEFIRTGNLDILRKWFDGTLTRDDIEWGVYKMGDTRCCGWVRPTAKRFLSDDTSVPIMRILEALPHIRDPELVETIIGRLDLGRMSLGELAYLKEEVYESRDIDTELYEEIGGRCSPDNVFESELMKYLYHGKGSEAYCRISGLTLRQRYPEIPSYVDIDARSEQIPRYIEGLSDAFGPFSNKAGSRSAKAASKYEGE